MINYIPSSASDQLKSDIRKVSKIYYNRYSYLYDRFGEEGKEYTFADAVWLTSLLSQEKKIVVEQMEWLRSVLSNRGMPHIIIEDFFEIALEQEFGKRFKPLNFIFKKWAASRQKAISSEGFQKVETEICEIISQLPADKRKEYKTLLESAYADQLENVSDVYDKLKEWIDS